MGLYVVTEIAEPYILDQDRITCFGDMAAAASDDGVAFQGLENCGDWRVEKAVIAMRQSLRHPISIGKLANNLAISRPQLKRVFLSRTWA
ncbi:MAG: hypothetical protein KTR21_12370 [Rhodobacteraceae bacterium]|nr:hypothetical protein [Paracoccaceae bacterium]